MQKCNYFTEALQQINIIYQATVADAGSVYYLSMGHIPRPPEIPTGAVYFLGTLHNFRPLELPTGNVYLLETFHTPGPSTLRAGSVYLLGILVSSLNCPPCALVQFSTKTLKMAETYSCHSVHCKRHVIHNSLNYTTEHPTVRCLLCLQWNT